MGEQISSIVTRRERQQYREKVQQCLDVFARMLSSSHFEDTDPMVGLEIELNLVDRELRPSMTNESALSVTTEAFQSELGRFNIELNVDPRPLHGDHLRQLEDNLRAELDDAHAAVPDAGIVCVGILPTLTAEAMSAEVLSPDLRYKALNDSILDARGEDVLIDIQGRSGERFSQYFDTIAPEAACTSMQMHLLVSPTDFASYWNAAQAISGVQVALGANSPFLFGNRLWDETRVPLFYQATDTRPPELRNQGVRPRVFFGERWVTSVFDLFEENVRYFPALLPEMSEEDPVAVLDEGASRPCASCACTTARSTGGTGRSTTTRRACPTCGSRTACSRPAPPSSTRSPTAPSTTGSSGRWPPTTDRCGAGCRSTRRTRTSPTGPSAGCGPGSTGPVAARCRSTSWCCGTCCRSRTAAWRCGAWTPTCATATSTSSRDAAPARPTGRPGSPTASAPSSDAACPATTRSRACSSATSTACTPTSRCTPGSSRR
ncbi:hypothetical protein [Arsenicicoccus piscis]|uniref:hypothetical protein n=1 Tax=Arsenicicoccus piscis TaxID=673954 RepID=UPI0032AF5380